MEKYGKIGHFSGRIWPDWNYCMGGYGLIWVYRVN